MNKYLIHYVDTRNETIEVYEYEAVRAKTVKQCWKYIAVNDFTKYKMILNIKMDSRILDFNESDYKKVTYLTTL